MKTVREITDLKDKKVFLRVDLDLAVSDGEITESFRAEKQKETLDYLVKNGAKVVMVAHISDVESFSELIPQLHILLGYEIGFIKDVDSIASYLDSYSVPGLLDNIRLNEGEEKNDPEFSKRLASNFDIYVNNAFATCHRDHASISGVPSIIPSYAGFVIQEEVAQLEKSVAAPADGKLIIIGGAKASTKIPVIKNLLDKSEAILLGGVVANDFLKERGQDMGSSMVDEDSAELLKGIDINDPRLILPTDFIVFDNKILDIGDKTMKDYIDRISRAKMIIWNGPMGLFENPVFAKGTNEIIMAMANSSAYKIVGGGDSISALDKTGLLSKFDFVSIGGGAMLAFLAGEEMPGLKALEYNA